MLKYRGPATCDKGVRGLLKGNSDSTTTDSCSPPLLKLLSCRCRQNTKPWRKPCDAEGGCGFGALPRRGIRNRKEVSLMLVFACSSMLIESGKAWKEMAACSSLDKMPSGSRRSILGPTSTSKRTTAIPRIHCGAFSMGWDGICQLVISQQIEF